MDKTKRFEIETFKQKIAKKVPDPNDRVLLMMTMAGVSGMLAEFIADCFQIENLPTGIKYALAITSANIKALIADGEIRTEEVLEDYKMSEQQQEDLHRVFTKIIKKLYHSLNEDDK